MSLSPQNVIRTTHAEITVIPTDIVHIKYHTNVVLSVNDFEESKAVFESLTKEKAHKILIEFSSTNKLTAAAQDYAEEELIDAVAEAIIANSIVHRMAINLYLLLHKQMHPVRVFSNVQDGIKWLNTF